MTLALQRLHTEFQRALQDKTYIGLNPSNPSVLVKTNHKNIRLHEVYVRAQQAIASSLEGINREELQSTLVHLRLLEADGNAYYQRYCQQTKTWVRWILKGIAACTPRFLKRILPRLFSNSAREAEEKTKENYEGYKRYIQSRLRDLNSSPAVPPVPIPSPDPSASHPPSEPSAPPATSPKKDDNKQSADGSNKINPEIKKTSVSAAPSTYIKVGYRSLGSQTMLQLANEQDKRLQESALKNYQGKLRTDSIQALKALDDYLSKDPSCQPQVLEVPLVSEQQITKEILEHLLDLSERIPHLSLTGLKKLDLNNLKLSAEVEKVFLSKISSFSFPDLTSLALTSHINDADLLSLYNQGYLHPLSSLDLKNCPLSTDVLFALTGLPQLNELNLPDNLKLGSRSLGELPKFDNPFKINLFYTNNSLTRLHVNTFYTGLSLWSAAFQIPLARARVPLIFPPTQLVLDPKSVTYWLYKNDYQQLQPQGSVRSIVADNCEYLNDDNLVDFIQRFPQATELSLANCPHVTDKGIVALLKACPEFVKIDLTGCRGVTDEFLFNHEAWAHLAQLTLIAHDTGISQVMADNFKDPAVNHEISLKARLIFEAKTLKITNEDLTDEQALERLLDAQPLQGFLHLDLSNCTRLTDKALSAVLDRLNVDQGKRRLNLATLNLQGCSQVTEKAFDDKLDNNKITPKILNTLSQIAIGETNIKSTILTGLYPRLTVQDTLTPQTYRLDLDQQLQACQQDPNTSSYLQGRMALEIFGEKATNQELLSQVRKTPVDFNAPAFKGMTLSFATSLEATRTPGFPVHKDLLYAQSAYFRSQLRSGGEMAFSSSIDLINQNATLPAVETIVNLMHGKGLPQHLDWQAISKAAELVNNVLEMPSVYYRQLLRNLRQHFTLEKADQILFDVCRLGDEQEKKYYEGKLMEMASVAHQEDRSIDKFSLLTQLGQTYQLKRLQNELTEVEAQRIQLEGSLNLSTFSQRPLQDSSNLSLQQQELGLSQQEREEAEIAAYLLNNQLIPN